jgi:hypothetical protein
MLAYERTECFYYATAISQNQEKTQIFPGSTCTLVCGSTLAMTSAAAL